MRQLACCAAIILASSMLAQGQPAAALSVEALLKDRLGISAADVSSFASGNSVVWSVPASAGNEIAAAGAIRAKGDLRRMVAWLRDIEAFMRAAGTVNVGAIANPATPADFARISLDEAAFRDLRSCRPGRCDVRMPATYVEQFQNVAWDAPDAKQQAEKLARTLIGEYVLSYQKSGDVVGGAPGEFQDMLRRSTMVWDLAYPFVSYLETFPKGAPAGTDSRFYWTRDQAGRKPTLTLHHVVLNELPEGRILVADKQFYASREIDAALMIALGVPNADYTSFDLVVAVKARASAMGGVAGRLLRGRIEKEVREGLAIYLDWIRGSAAL